MSLVALLSTGFFVAIIGGIFSLIVARYNNNKLNEREELKIALQSKIDKISALNNAMQQIYNLNKIALPSSDKEGYQTYIDELNNLLMQYHSIYGSISYILPDEHKKSLQVRLDSTQKLISSISFTCFMNTEDFHHYEPIFISLRRLFINIISYGLDYWNKQ